MTWKFVLALGLVSALASGQLQTGDLAATGYSTSQFSLLTNAVSLLTVNAGSFGGGFSQSILWDPANPQSFLVGGF